MSFRKELERIAHDRTVSRQSHERTQQKFVLQQHEARSALIAERKAMVDAILRPVRGMINRYMTDLGDVTWGSGQYSRSNKVFDKEPSKFPEDWLAEWVIERYMVRKLPFLGTQDRDFWQPSRPRDGNWDAHQYYRLSVWLIGEQAQYGTGRNRTNNLSEEALRVCY